MFKARWELPPRIRALPRDHRGYPVPWFVAHVDGTPDFRLSDPRKFIKALRFKLCWICGDTLGRSYAFVLGPMCVVNQTSAEPPCHFECAKFAVTHCPFLVLPNAQRREANLPPKNDTPGEMLLHNPGACVVWVTRSYEIFNAHAGAEGILFEVGYPEQVYWYTEGREATLDEAKAAIERGLPTLQQRAEQEHSEAELAERVKRAMRYLPIAHEYNRA